MESEEKISMEKQDTGGLVSIHLEGYEVLEKIVKPSGNSGRIYLPNDWIGGTVKIVRITPLDRKED